MASFEDCSHPGSEGANFCPHCGARLSSPPTAQAAPSTPVASAAPPASASSGERRQLTVLFCDLVGSAELGSRVDPEIFHDIVDAYYNTCGEAIARYDGHIANYLGDGIVALFGYPYAHEDSADNAVLAALALQNAITAGVGAERMHGEAIAARVGIHTGLVIVSVVGSVERREIHALGDAVNIAARVQGHAESGSVMITEATRRLLRAPFSFTERGLAPLKGIAEPVALSRVDAASAAAPSASAIETRRAAIPFVGRDAERARIASAWRSARDGAGRNVLVRGEPGIGKSRLVAQAHVDIGADEHRWIEVEASRMLQQSAFMLTRALAKRILDWGPDTTNAEGRVLLDASFVASSPNQPGAAETRHFLRDLLGVLDDDDSAPIMSKEQVRKRMVRAYASWLRDQLRRHTTVLVVEDLHWADPSSIEVLTACLDDIDVDHVLAIFTARLEFQDPWSDGAAHSVVSLPRLDADEARQIIRRNIAEATRTAELVDELVARSDGVPLFAEELALAYVDTATDSSVAIPATLYDSLMARLDRLPTAKPLAQLAAVFGRDFSAHELRTVSGYSADAFDSALDELVGADLVAVEHYAADARCQFRHALVQQAAYDSLLHRRRTEVHRAIADMMLAEHDAAVHPQLEVIARHLTEANEVERAIDAWQQAADRAASTSANREAVTLYESALTLLEQLPPSVERTKREVTILVDKLGYHFVIEGPSGPSAVATLARARELSATLPRDGFQHLEVIANAVSFTLSRGDLETARELADDFSRAAEEAGSQSAINQAHISQASVALNHCELERAVHHAELALRQRGSHEHQFGPQFQRGFALLYGGMASCLLGDTDRADEWSTELIGIATQAGDDPVASLMATVGATVLAVWRRDHDQVQPLAASIEETGRLFGLDLLTGWGCLYGGWSEALTGAAADGAQRAERGLGMHIEVRQQLGIAHSFALVAEAQLCAGAFAAGIATIDDALSQRDHIQLHHHTAELLRVRAALGDAGSDPAVDVEADLRESIRIAEAIGARLLQLRSREQYARWLVAHGDRASACITLESIVAGIPASRSGVDIDAARTTLAELTRSTSRS